jgi:hypothetical protein
LQLRAKGGFECPDRPSDLHPARARIGLGYYDLRIDLGEDFSYSVLIGYR